MSKQINHINYIYTDRKGREHTVVVQYENISKFMELCIRCDFQIIGKDGSYYGSTLDEMEMQN